MWQQYSPNQHYKKVLFLVVFFTFTQVSHGDDAPASSPIGVFQSIDEIIRIHKNKFKSTYESSNQNFRQLLNSLKSENIHLHPDFTQSLLLFSPKKYVDLIQENKCHFYSLLSTGLLKTAQGPPQKLVVIIKNKSGKNEVAQISVEDFIKIKTQHKCQNIEEIRKIFSGSNIKSTIKKISFPVPQTQLQCIQLQDEWKKNDYLPYLCGIKEKLIYGRALEKQRMNNGGSENLKQVIKQNRILKEYKNLFSATTLFQRSYLQSLCDHLDDSLAYCSLYLSSHIWDKILNAEKPKYFMDYICADAYPTKKVNDDLRRLCRNKLIGSPDSCHFFDSSKDKQQFFPHESCHNISLALNNSRLESDYQECPSRIDNESITNYHRLIDHFRKKKKDHSQTRCDHVAINNFAKTNIDFQNEQAWPMKLCYHDKFEDEEVCKTYIPGEDRNEEFSEVNMVSKIINKQMSLRSDAKCKIVPKSKYRPQYLEYKNGCYIIFEDKSCTLLNCKKTIIVDQKRISLIKYKGHPKMEHIPSSFANEKFSQDNVLKETFKLETRRILNLTMLKNFLSVKDKRLIHGVGCIEDLLPRSFKRRNLQNCTPHPFIVDGLMNKDADTYLVFRSSIENVHYPRLVRWQNVFNGVSNFKEVHPLQTWALIGLKYESN